MPRFVPSASAGTAVANGDAQVAGPTEATPAANVNVNAKEQERQGIRAIAKSDVHRITSGQVVLDLQSAVKELVENALDAGSTSIEIRFRKYGIDGLEVIDNGQGIKEEDYDSVALKHYTSKIEDFDDLSYVRTFGFRGEALSSLCVLGKVTILTATREEAPMGTLLEFAQDGSIQDRSKKMARQRGCTVSVTDLFHSLPVRRRELEKNCKREYGKAQSLLQAYSLISRGVRWQVVNISKEGKKTGALTMSSASAGDWLSKNFAALFGSKSPASMQPLDLEIEFERSKPRKRDLLQTSSRIPPKRRKVDDSDEEADDADAGRSDEGEGDDDAEDDVATAADGYAHQAIAVKGLISRPTKGCGRTTSDRQFLYINGRPWDSVKLSRAFNEVYRQYNTNQVPMLVADFMLPTDSYDVNVSPDKRTIFLHDERELIEALKEALEDLFAPSRGTLAVNSSLGPAMTQQKLTYALSSDPVPVSSDAPDKDDESEAEDDEEPLSGDEDCAPSRQAVRSPERFLQDRAGGLSEPPSEEEEEQDSQPLFLDTRASPSSSRPSMQPPAHRALRDDSRATAPSSHVAQPRRGGIDTSSLMSRIGGLRSQAGQGSASRASLHSSPPARSPSLGATLSQYAAPGSTVQHTRPASDDDDEREALEYREDDLEEQDRLEAAKPADEDRQSGDNVAEEVNDLETSTASPPEQEGDARDEQDPASLRAKHVSMPSEDFDDDERQGVTQVTRDLATQQSETSADVEYSPGSISINMERLSRSVAKQREWRKRHADPLASSSLPESASLTQQVSAAAGINNQDAKTAEGALERVITKVDFDRMEILGQFNLGFIVARRRIYPDSCSASNGQPEALHPRAAAPIMDDLFIIDQHASDEKYNFETLQRTTRIRSQRLIHSRTLELAAPDELVAAQHQDTTLRANGFEVAIDPDLPAGSRVRLVAQPVSGKTVFGARDLEELLHELHESGAEPECVPHGQQDPKESDTQRPTTTRKVIRCPRMRAMFASRACRRSVMIGTALTRRQMRGIVSNMGGLEQPWNCPHGRPTMRHLACLKSLGAGAGDGGLRSARNRSTDWKRLQELD